MQIIKRKRLFNSGRLRTRKRTNGKRLSVKQKLFFGSKAQRAAAKRSISSKGRSRRPNASYSRKKKYSRRRKNVGEIITLDLVRKNTGRRKNMATRRKRRTNVGSRRRRRVNSATPIRRRRRNRGVRITRRRRTNGVVRRRRSRRNVGVTRRRRRNSSRRVVSPRRRRNSGRRRISRRRNTGYRRNGMGSAVTKGLGIVAGMWTTGKLNDMLSSFSPSLASGPMSIASTAIIAFAQGWAIRKFTGKVDLAENVMIGGLALAAIKALNMFAPQFAPSLSGLGLIGGSSFTYPQVMSGNNYGKFQIAPDYAAAIQASAAANAGPGMRGIYPTASGGGRMGLKRVGRFS